MPDVTHEKGLHVYILYVNIHVLVHLLLVICCIYIIDTYIDSFIIASISIYTYTDNLF